MKLQTNYYLINKIFSSIKKSHNLNPLSITEDAIASHSKFFLTCELSILYLAKKLKMFHVEHLKETR